MPQLSLREEVQPDPHTRVLCAAGDLDLASGGQVVRWVTAAVAEGAKRLVIDLSAAGYLDSRALAALIAARKHAAMNRCELAVVSPADSRLRVIFELTHLERYLQLADSRDEALARLS